MSGAGTAGADAWRVTNRVSASAAKRCAGARAPVADTSAMAAETSSAEASVPVEGDELRMGRNDPALIGPYGYGFESGDPVAIQCQHTHLHDRESELHAICAAW